jgi:uncharacterized protein YgiM (DUF1202 family)
VDIAVSSVDFFPAIFDSFESMTRPVPPTKRTRRRPAFLYGRRLLMAIIILLLAHSAQADPFTILAPSGLNLRSGPGPQHPKVLTLPFGTVVEAILTQRYAGLSKVGQEVAPMAATPRTATTACKRWPRKQIVEKL